MTDTTRTDTTFDATTPLNIADHTANNTIYNNTNFADTLTLTCDAAFIPTYTNTVTDIVVTVNTVTGVVTIYNSLDDVATDKSNETNAIELFIGEELELVGEALAMLGHIYTNHSQFEPTLTFIPYDTLESGNVTIATFDDEPNIHLHYVDRVGPADPIVEVPSQELVALGQLLIDIAHNPQFAFKC